MTDTPNPQLSSEAMGTLQSAMHNPEISATQVRAAQIVLQRTTPKSADEEQNEAEERESALAEARGLLAEFAALKHTNIRLSREVDQASQTATTNPAG
jgi:hypothetical protein